MRQFLVAPQTTISRNNENVHAAAAMAKQREKSSAFVIGSTRT